MGKKTTVQSNDPWAPAQPYILKNLRQQDKVFNSTQPQLEDAAQSQRQMYNRIAPRAENGIIAAQQLVNRNLSGANLTRGNPYLDAILSETRDDVMDAVGDQFGTAGRFGSGMHAAILGRELADAENAMRYQDYGVERGYQQQAINDAQNLMGGSQSIINNAAELPWIGVQAANGAVRQASGGYGTSTQTQNNGFGNTLMGIAGMGLQGAAMFSDRRMKRGVKLLRRLRDGLGVYRWTYAWGEPSQGVMADEVARLRPWARGPRVAGYETVNYGAL